MKKSIRKIEVQHLTDESPDTSYLGKYSNTPAPDAIDRAENGDLRRNEFRYFNPAMTGAETGNPESPRQDYERFEALNRGDWCYIGVRARAEIVVAGVSQTITSAGIFGVESDSDKEYLKELAKEELSQLSDTLKELGFSTRAIIKALKDDE